MSADNRKLPLAAAVDDGRLVVSIGLDTLDELRNRLRGGDDRVSAADIADFLVNRREEDGEDAATPFEAAIMIAEVRAKEYDEALADDPPSTEFWR